MGLLDAIEKALFEQKSEAQLEEEKKGIKVFDLPAPERKFSWKVAFDLLRGKEVPERPNRWHHQDIMLAKSNGFDLIRVYKREMSKEEGLKATAEFNKYMLDAIAGRNKPKEKEKTFSFAKFVEMLKSASDREVTMARGKSREFNDLVEKEEQRRRAQRSRDTHKTVEVSVDRAVKNDRDQGDVAIEQVMGVGADGSVQNLGKMYKKRMTEKELKERRESGEKWRRMDDDERKTYVRFEREQDDSLER